MSKSNSQEKNSQFEIRANDVEHLNRIKTQLKILKIFVHDLLDALDKTQPDYELKKANLLQRKKNIKHIFDHRSNLLYFH